MHFSELIFHLSCQTAAMVYSCAQATLYTSTTMTRRTQTCGTETRLSEAK
jgi:hypothetical protein